MSIQFKRGTQAKVDAETTTLLRGQPLIATDTGELTIGTETNQLAQLGKKYVPMELMKQKEYQLSMSSDSYGEWTNPISGVTSPSTSGFVFQTTLSSIDYTDIRTALPTWATVSGMSGNSFVVVKIPSAVSRSAFGGGYNYLKIESAVSGQNKAITYFVFNTYSTKLPDGNCYMILSCEGGGINTTNTSTPTVINCSIIEVVAGDTYLNRSAGYTYYDGKKLVAKSDVALTRDIPKYYNHYISLTNDSYNQTQINFQLVDCRSTAFTNGSLWKLLSAVEAHPHPATGRVYIGDSIATPGVVESIRAAETLNAVTIGYRLEGTSALSTILLYLDDCTFEDAYLPIADTQGGTETTVVSTSLAFIATSGSTPFRDEYDNVYYTATSSQTVTDSLNRPIIDVISAVPVSTNNPARVRISDTTISSTYYSTAASARCKWSVLVRYRVDAQS